MSSRERAVRDGSMWASFSRGRTLREIATEHDLTTRQVQRIIASWKADGSAPDGSIDPIAEIRETLLMMRQATADLARIEEQPDNNAAHIGATRLKMELRLRRIELLQALGLLPRRLGALSAEREMQQIFRDFAELLQEHGVSADAVAAMEALSERPLHRPPSALAPLLEGAA